jgi:hypothetical protein
VVVAAAPVLASLLGSRFENECSLVLIANDDQSKQSLSFLLSFGAGSCVFGLGLDK